MHFYKSNLESLIVKEHASSLGGIGFTRLRTPSGRVVCGDNAEDYVQDYVTSLTEHDLIKVKLCEKRLKRLIEKSGLCAAYELSGNLEGPAHFWINFKATNEHKTGHTISLDEFHITSKASNMLECLMVKPIDFSWSTFLNSHESSIQFCLS